MKFRLGLSGEEIQNRVDARFECVGMVRGEYLARKSRHYITTELGRSQAEAYVRNVCAIFAPATVTYRLIELESIEANVLLGVDRVLIEEVPMLGIRGVRRGLRYQDTLAREGNMLARVWTDHPNLEVLLPYVTDASEIERLGVLLRASGFGGKISTMVEIPAAALLVDELLDRDIHEVVVGMNDLTSLVLGAERGSEYHDFSHPAVWKLLESMQRACARRGVPIGIAGYLPRAILNRAAGCGFDFAVVHYSHLRFVFEGEFTALDQVEVMRETKEWTRAAIAEYLRSELSVPSTVRQTAREGV